MCPTVLVCNVKVFNILYAGPRLFLTCPMNVDAARLWFVDLWNYSVIPYLLDALRDVSKVRSRWFYRVRS